MHRYLKLGGDSRRYLGCSRFAALFDALEIAKATKPNRGEFSTCWVPCCFGAGNLVGGANLSF